MSGNASRGCRQRYTQTSKRQAARTPQDVARLKNDFTSTRSSCQVPQLHCKLLLAVLAFKALSEICLQTAPVKQGTRVTHLCVLYEFLVHSVLSAIAEATTSSFVKRSPRRKPFGRQGGSEFAPDNIALQRSLPTCLLIAQRAPAETNAGAFEILWRCVTVGAAILQRWPFCADLLRQQVGFAVRSMDERQRIRFLPPPEAVPKTVCEPKLTACVIMGWRYDAAASDPEA